MPSSPISSFRVDPGLVLMAIKLIQPGILSDVHEGVLRIVPISIHHRIKKEDVREQIIRLRNLKLVEMYEGRRYRLSGTGRNYVASLGLKAKIDSRRMFLLKETRRLMVSERSGARDGSLKQ